MKALVLSRLPAITVSAAILIGFMAQILPGIAQSPTSAEEPAAAASEPGETLRILFIGNSYTARHWLPKVVTTLAEEGNPGLDVEFTQVIYGGRRLVDHWRLGTANFVRLHSLTIEEEKATIAQLEKAISKGPKDGYAKNALGKHRADLQRIAWQGWQEFERLRKDTQD